MREWCAGSRNPQFESEGVNSIEVIPVESLVPDESELLVQSHGCLVSHFCL